MLSEKQKTCPVCGNSQKIMGQESTAYDHRFKTVYYMKLFCRNCTTTWSSDYYYKDTIKEPSWLMKIMLALFGKKEIREEEVEN